MGKEIRVGIVGFGNMGRAIGQSIAAAGLWKITAYDKSKAQLKNLKNIKIAKTLEEVITGNSIIILAVKPQDAGGFIRENLVYFLNAKPLVISIAAGLPIKYFQKLLKGIKIVRVMPNLAAIVNESFSLLCKGILAEPSDVAISKKIFSRIGKVVVVDESYLDKATSISGSGPGYVYYFMEVLYNCALKLGFTKKTAREMVSQTFFGASKLAKLSKKDFCQMKEKVTSKKGTTEAALHIFEKCGLRSVIQRGVGSSYKRAKEISKIYTRNQRV